MSSQGFVNRTAEEKFSYSVFFTLLLDFALIRYLIASKKVFSGSQDSVRVQVKNAVASSASATVHYIVHTAHLSSGGQFARGHSLTIMAELLYHSQQS